MVHELKISPAYFEDVISGRKTFEVRKNDRDFRENDYVALKEFRIDAPDGMQYTGRSAIYRITYILDNPEFCKAGYVVMGIEKYKEEILYVGARY